MERLALDEFARRRPRPAARKKGLHGVRLKPIDLRQKLVAQNARVVRQDETGRLFFPPISQGNGQVIVNDVFTANKPPSGVSSVSLLFWGSAWSSAGAPVSWSEMVAQTQVLLGTNYFSQIGQYGVGPPVQIASALVPPEVTVDFLGVPVVITIDDPQNDFTDAQVNAVAELAALNPAAFFGGGGAPINPALYLLITPPDVSNSNALGEHDWDAAAPFAFGWATADVGLDQTLITITHEIIETLTDTDTATGYRDSLGNEIADVCDPYSAVKNGVAVQAYYSNALDACVIPDNIDPVTLSSGFFVQSTYGEVGNFEVVYPSGDGGIVHYWRNNDDPSLPWAESGRFLSPNTYQGLCLIQSNYNYPGDLYGAAIDLGGAVWELRRDPSGAWSQTPILVGPGGGTALVGAVGIPAMIQSRSDFVSIVRGTFYMVLAMQDGSLQLFERYNDVVPPFNSFTPVWSAGSNVLPPGTLQSSAPAVSVVQTSYMIYAAAGFQPILPAQDPPLDALEIMINDGGSLLHVAGPPGGPYVSDSLTIGNGDLLGRPALIQSTYGITGNLELVVASQNHGVNHYWRNNDIPLDTWNFGAQLPFRYAGDVSLIESKAGTLEIIVVDQDGDYIGHLSRNTSNEWQPVTFIGTGD